MKTGLAVLLSIIGIVSAIYVGGYLMFIGGIIQIVNSITPVIIAKGIAFGFARIFFAGLTTWIVAVLTLIPVQALLS